MIEENIDFWQVANTTDFEIQKKFSLRKTEHRVKRTQRLLRTFALFWPRLIRRVSSNDRPRATLSGDFSSFW